jgi:AcrR family transcriptional regulator
MTRVYRSPARAEAAARTRAAIVASARELLVTEGYVGATVERIAHGAGVNIDTVYRSVGRKAEVMRAVVESALSGSPDAVPAQQRDYVLRIREASTAGEKLDTYAGALVAIQQRLAPVFAALRDAAHTDESSRELWRQISERRARNMREFAGELRSTGELRDDLDDEQVADIVWSMNGPEYWILLVEERGWPPERFERWIADAWRRLLLRRS